MKYQKQDILEFDTRKPHEVVEKTEVDKANGIFHLNYDNDIEYKGQINLDNMPHGKGAIGYSSMHCYNGEFANGLPSGDGTYIFNIQWISYIF